MLDKWQDGKKEKASREAFSRFEMTVQYAERARPEPSSSALLTNVQVAHALRTPLLNTRP